MARNQEESAASPSYVGFVDEAYLEALRKRHASIKAYAHEQLRLSAGMSILDVGCGPASDTLDFAAVVGELGTVRGVDHDNNMVALANHKAEVAGMNRFVAHEQGDATALPFPDHAFDAVFSERLLQHVPDGPRVISELVRVAKPGGRVVVVDTDQSSGTVDFVEPELMEIEWRLRRVRATQLRDSYSGRKLFRYFHHAGLKDVEVKPFAVAYTSLREARYESGLDFVTKGAVQAGAVSEEELAQWNRAQESVDRQGAFFMYIVVMVVSGQKAKGS